MPAAIATSAAISTLRERADRHAEHDQDRERDREVIGDALLEAERAGREAELILEEPRADDRRRAHGGDQHAASAMGSLRSEFGSARPFAMASK